MPSSGLILLYSTPACPVEGRLKPEDKQAETSQNNCACAHFTAVQLSQQVGAVIKATGPVQWSGKGPTFNLQGNMLVPQGHRKIGRGDITTP